VLCWSAVNRSSSAAFPVVLFVHAESYDVGTGNAYDGSVLAAFANVVVVTFNFRLGALGTILPAVVLTDVKPAFHDADTDTDIDTDIIARILADTSDTRDFPWQAYILATILARMSARMSVSVSLSAS